MIGGGLFHSENSGLSNRLERRLGNNIKGLLLCQLTFVKI